MANTNTALHAANRNKKDEFYTQLSDIEKELSHYREYFKDKVVLCNCDDPYESNFFKYFALNFNALGLKKLMATCYDGSPISGLELPLLFELPLTACGEGAGGGAKTPKKIAYKVEITEIPDLDGNGATDLSDVRLLLQSDKNIMQPLRGNGDFRSQECVELLKQADVVVTNPPFSLFREYVAQLVKYDKKFLIIGNVNAITYKEFFPLIKENKVWMGATGNGSDMVFGVPKGANVAESDRAKAARLGYVGDFTRLGNSCWFTNIDHGRRHQPLQLMTMADNIKFSRHKEIKGIGYQHYDNYDAIEVPYTDAIPSDYEGVMGVPISFLDKYCPEQFEIVGLDRYVEDNPNYGHRFTIESKETYARILIRKR